MAIFRIVYQLNGRWFVADEGGSEFENVYRATPEQEAEFQRRTAKGDCGRAMGPRSLLCHRFFPKEKPCLREKCAIYHRGASKGAELVNAQVAYRSEKV